MDYGLGSDGGIRLMSALVFRGNNVVVGNVGLTKACGDSKA